MALPLETYKKVKQKALLHLQVELDPISQNIEEWDEKFPVTGKNIRIFRGSRICRLGHEPS